MSTDEKTSANFATVLRKKDYLLLWLAQLISNMGDAFARIAALIFVTAESNSPVAISVLMLVELAPMIVFGPVIGVFVDRWDRKKILIGSDIARAILFLLLALYPQYGMVLAVMFMATLASLFFTPARAAVLPAVVGDEQVTAAVGLSQTTFQTVALIGPVLGGAMAGFLGTGVVFGFNAVTFLVSAALVQLMTIPLKARRSAPVEAAEDDGTSEPGRGVQKAFRDFYKQLGFGIKFLRQDSVLWYLIVLIGSFSVIGHISQVGIMDYVRNVLALSPTRFGLMMTFTGAGSVVGAVLMGNLGSRLHRGWSFYLNFIGVTVVMSLYYFQPLYYPLLALAFLGGFFYSSANVPMQSIVFTRTPVEVRGRVFSVANSLLNGAAIISLPAAGFIINYIGSSLTIALVGVIGTAFMLISRLFPGSSELLAKEAKDEGSVTA